MAAETARPDLSRVSETLLIPLYYRAIETRRPDAMITDEKAVELVEELRYDFDRIRQIPMNEANKVMRIMLSREMDRYTRDFLSRHPEGVVVHIGCGLDARFERVDNRQVEWYDLDLPNVIALRRKWVGDEKARYHLLGCSMLDSSWQETVRAQAQWQDGRPRPFLFLAEGVFMYFEEVQIKGLVQALLERFTGAELVFDSWTPLQIWLGNLILSPTHFGKLFRWGFWRGQKIEGWGGGIRLLDEWGYFDRPEPRLAAMRWMGPIFRLLKPMRIFHFQLG